MVYGIAEALGYNAFFLVFVVLARKRKHPWVFYLIGLGIQLLSYVGAFAEANLRGESVNMLHIIVTAVIAVIGAITCSKAKTAKR